MAQDSVRLLAVDNCIKLGKLLQAADAVSLHPCACACAVCVCDACVCVFALVCVRVSGCLWYLRCVMCAC